mgnify:CR=1 FL=1
MHKKVCFITFLYALCTLYGVLDVVHYWYNNEYIPCMHESMCICTYAPNARLRVCGHALYHVGIGYHIGTPFMGVIIPYNQGMYRDTKCRINPTFSSLFHSLIRMVSHYDLYNGVLTHHRMW